MTTTQILALLAVLGTLAGSLGGTWLQALLTARREHAGHLRDLRTALYVDVAAYTQRAEAMLDWLTEPWPYRQRHPRPPAEVPHPERVTAHMNLLAPQPLQDAWRRLLEVEAALHWNVQEDGENDPDGSLTASSSDPDVQAMRAAIREVNATARSAISSP